uniref:Cytochrome c oxidase subunit 2 n=1 Tax=Geloina coaxans TaxID=499929 RepID=A0A0R8SPH4_9BIVA|nr:cytochrome c oxidase subunit II [Geloina coaxans]
MWGQWGFPNSGTENAGNLVLYHDLTLVVAVVVLVLVVWFLGIFLFGKFFFGGMMNRYVHKNDLLEIVWTVSPAFVLFILGYVSLVNLYQMELGDKTEHLVKVTGHQWYWDYEYMVSFDDYEKLGYVGWFCGELMDNEFDSIDWILKFCGDLGLLQLVGEWNLNYDSFMVPLSDLLSKFPSFESGFRNADVTNPCFMARSSNNEVLICTTDVMHSWGLSELGVKVDAVPGRTNSLGIIPYSSGVAYGNCYELCGVGHSTMPIKAVIGSFSDIYWLLKNMILETEEVDGFLNELE